MIVNYYFFKKICRPLEIMLILKLKKFVQSLQNIIVNIIVMNL